MDNSSSTEGSNSDNDQYLVGVAARLALFPVKEASTALALANHFLLMPNSGKGTKSRSLNNEQIRELCTFTNRYHLCMPSVRESWRKWMVVIQQDPGRVSSLTMDVVLELLTVLSSRTLLTQDARDQLIVGGVPSALLRRVADFVSDVRGDEPKVPWAPSDADLDYDPLEGDTWVRASRRLFVDLNVPEIRESFGTPETPILGPIAVAYWHPLYVLTYTALGWSRPAVGLARWVLSGMPVREPALALLRARWSLDAMGFAFHPHGEEMLSIMGPVKGSRLTTTYRLDGDFGRYAMAQRPFWGALSQGGGDPLHSFSHMRMHVSGNGENAKHLLIGGNSKEVEAHLLLNHYEGWHAALRQLGRSLPASPDGGSWKVHVTTKDVGYLGRFRRSQMTGNWYLCRTQTHELGN